MASDTFIYLEGGGRGAHSREGDIRCREGFRKLLESCGFQGRMPRLAACGGRRAAFGDFAARHSSANADFVALWIDSEEPLSDLEAGWTHLETLDGWERPRGAVEPSFVRVYRILNARL